MTSEYLHRPFSGYVAILMWFAMVAGAITLFVLSYPIVGVPLALISAFWLGGFVVINPNEARVFTLFGSYKGSCKENGFFWVNPLWGAKKISLRARNQDGTTIKVNDKIGNPIEIGTVLVWRVSDAYKAMFEVENFELFVKIQSETATRKLAGMYPYDNFDEHEKEISLRSGGEEVHEMLIEELKERLSIAGIEVMEARINHLAYASEIAGAMLQRQQATAIVAARRKIVEGAVGMVELALDALNEKSVVVLDEERKAAMVSNLLVVLCGDKATQPVVNTGTLHH